MTKPIKRYEPRMSGTKLCSKCRRDLAVIFFACASRYKDGLYSCCRECDSEPQKYRVGRKRGERLPPVPVLTATYRVGVW